MASRRAAQTLALALAAAAAGAPSAVATRSLRAQRAGSARAQARAQAQGQPRFYGLYSDCHDAACSNCTNSTLYFDRCTFEGGPGIMSVKAVCDVSTSQILNLEYADTPNCEGAEHANPVPTGRCLTGPFGEHYAFYCGTAPYVPPPPPGGVYGQIVVAEPGDKHCNDSSSAEWDWFTPGECVSPELFMTERVECDVAAGTWRKIVFDSEDCSGPALSNVTGKLNECALQTDGPERVMYQCSRLPIPPPGAEL